MLKRAGTRARRNHGAPRSLAASSASGADSASETPPSSSHTAPKKRLKPRSEVPPTRRRGGNHASSSDDDTSSQQTAKLAKKARLKKAGRMKRAPLLDYAVVEAVYSAMAGPEHRRARRQWLELFSKYESTPRSGAVTVERFCKCLPKLGVELDSRSDRDALASCFHCSGSDDDGGSGGESTSDDNGHSSSQLVDYVAFVDFASNVRDSEKLGKIATSLRESIAQYDGKKQSATSYSIATRLKKLDRHKRGWVTEEQFARVLEDSRGPALVLSETQVAALVDRFEYEYERQQLGIDYMQFAQWLQPMLHLDVDQLHKRVKMLVTEASAKHGWKLEEVFEVMDADGNGEVDSLELKEALWDMGLPLTDAQIRCLADEYDGDGDGKMQYKEFLELVSSSGKKRRPTIKRRKSHRGGGDTGVSGSESTDIVAKKKPRAKRNVRNTFSWGINKAFARKQGVGNRPNKAQKTATTAKQQSGEESSLSASSTPKSKRRNTKKKKRQSRKEENESTSTDEDVPAKRPSAKKSRGAKTRKRGLSSLSEDEEEEGPSSDSTSDNQERRVRRGRKGQRESVKAKRKAKAKPSEATSSTESERDQTDQATRKSKGSKRKTQKSKSSKRKHAKRSSDDEDGAKSDTGSTTDTPLSAAKVGSRSKQRAKGHRSSSASPKRRTRSRRLTSDARLSSGTRHRETPEHQRPRRRSVASPVPRSRCRRSTLGHQSKPLAARRQRRASQPKLSGSRMAGYSDDEEESSAVNNSDSSGLDVNHLRNLQRRRRRGAKRRSTHFQSEEAGEGDIDEAASDGVENNEDDNGEESSPSDDEYQKHLKRSLRRAFDFFDLDQTASIEKRELGHVLRALGHEFTSKELEAEMVSADLDRNGRLDFYEFVAFVRHQLAQKRFLLLPQREMEIRQAFESLDVDKNGALDEQEFEYLIYKVLQVELSVEEQASLLDFVDKDDDGLISEDEFIAFLKAMEDFQRKYGNGHGWKNHKRFLASLDEASQLAYSAMKKLVRGAPMDIDRNLLLFFGIPSNYRPAISSSTTCRTLHSNSMEHVLSFPSPQTIESLALDPRPNALEKKESSFFTLAKGGRVDEELLMLQHAEGIEAQAIVSLKRAAGVPKPFDAREEDVVKRCVHVCLFQEQEELPNRRKDKERASTAAVTTGNALKKAGAGVVVGNVHEIPVYWHQGEEDVWEFSRKATKQDMYKFLVRTNAVNDHLHLLVEFIVHLKMGVPKHKSKRHGSKGTSKGEANSSDDSNSDSNSSCFGVETREMVCCWSKIPVRQLLAKRSDVMRRKEKLWGGTAHAPVDIEQDELLRRRTGWRAVTNMFTKPSQPIMGIKSVPIDLLADDLQRFVRKMPPIVIAPFVSLPILAEYMVLVGTTLARAVNSSSVVACEPVLKLLPKIVDDHEALSTLRKAFDAEERQLKFQELVLRLWPSFVHWQEHLPPSLLALAVPPPAPAQQATTSNAPTTGTTATAAKSDGTASDKLKYRTSLLQSTAAGYEAMAGGLSRLFTTLQGR